MIFPGFPGVLSFFQVFQVEWVPWTDVSLLTTIHIRAQVMFSDVVVCLCIWISSGDNFWATWAKNFVLCKQIHYFNIQVNFDYQGHWVTVIWVNNVILHIIFAQACILAYFNGQGHMNVKRQNSIFPSISTVSVTDMICKWCVSHWLALFYLLLINRRNIFSCLQFWRSLTLMITCQKQKFNKLSYLPCP